MISAKFHESKRRPERVRKQSKQWALLQSNQYRGPFYRAPAQLGYTGANDSTNTS
ncbi:hypothetical protein QWJ46_17520 [Rhizobium sp. CBN3]|uniref:hypothetical protein n=1 Tax=Rhizobium sp. CBN3 TaxID=3058045 RepID=UPI002673C7A3|nr:hypothetical protein [Rhizobium sp. CBN3]MDO3434479.1 hypothetical protein [Rhizobium sp. CBN3]